MRKCYALYTLLMACVFTFFAGKSWGQLAQFDFPATSSLVVSAKNANVTVSNMALSTGTIETNITTGSYFPNEPYIEETGGWTSTTQAAAKSFQFTITAASGYVFSITNVSFRGYATSAGPSAFGFAIGSTDVYSVNAPDASIVLVNQSVSGQTGLTTATIKIQGWLNGSRTSAGSGVFRLDDVVITGTVSANVANPTGFTATTNSSTPTTQIDLAATAAGSNDFVIVQNTSGTFTTPSGTPGNVNDALAGGTIVYKGSTTTAAANTSLIPNTRYYYKAFSYNGSNYSSGVTADTYTYPGAPVIAAASAISNAGFTANWSAPTTPGTATYTYSIDRDVSNTFSSPTTTSSIASGTTSQVYGSLAAQTQYFYRVRAANAAGNSSYSSTQSVYTYSNPATSAAGSFAANATSGSNIDLSWTTATFPVSGATANGYIILRRTGSTPNSSNVSNGTAPASLSLPSGTTLVATITSGSTLTFGDAGLTAGATYGYIIIPFTWDDANAATYNYYTTSAPTASATTTTSVDNPASFTATTSSASQINLAATANTNGENVVVVFNLTGTFTAPSGAPGNVGDALAGGTIVYKGSAAGLTNHTSLTSNTQYFYKAYAYDGSNNYSGGVTANAYTLADAPTANAATDITDVSFTANWSTVSGITSYRLDVATDNAFTSILSGYNNLAVTGTSQSVTGLTASSTYYCRVRSENTGGSSVNSNTITVNMLAAAPTAQPTAFTATGISNNAMTIGWTAATGAPAGYIVVQRSGASYSTTDPVDGTTYTAGDVLGNGTIAYSGSSLSAALSSLSAATQYSFKIYSYNGSGSTINYLTASPLQGQAYTYATEPTVQATITSFTTPLTDRFTITFGSGTGGAGRMVVVRQGSAVNFTPVDGTAYTANTVFTGGTGVGPSSDNKVVYFGTANTVTVTGLTANTTYHVAVYEYSGAANTYNYLTTTLYNTGNYSTLATEPTTPPTSFTSSSGNSTSMTVSWTAASGNPDGYLVVYTTGTTAPGSSFPIDSVSYTAGTVGSAANGIGSGNIVAYSGSATSFTLSGLSANASYSFRITAYNGSGKSTNYYTGTGATLTGTGYTLGAEPTAQATFSSFASVDTTRFTLNFTAGTGGSGRLVVIRQGNPVDFVPVDGTSYTANTDFSAGTGLGASADNKVVQAGTGTSINPVTGLTPGQLYYVAVYEFSGSAANGNINYLTTTASNTGSRRTPPTRVRNLTVTARTTSSISLSWTNGGGNGRIVVARATSSTAAAPAYNGSYTVASNSFVDAGNSTTGTGNIVVYKGTGNSVTVTGLSTATSYTFHVYEYQDSTASTSYGSDVNTGATFTLSTEPTQHPSTFTATANSATSVTLTFPAATSIGAEGYVIMKKTGTAVTSYPVDGNAYTVNTVIGVDSVAASIATNSTTTTNVTVVSGETTYFAIIPFNWDGSNSGTRNYYTDPTIKTVSITTVSSATDVVAVANSESATIASTLNTASITNTSDGAQVWQFRVRDGGVSGDGDLLPTTISALTFTQGSGNAIDNFSNAIQSIALFNGTTPVAGSVTVTSNQVQFTGLSLIVPDNDSITITLRLSVKANVNGGTAPTSSTGNNVDGDDFQFQLSASNITVGDVSASSQLASFSAISSTNGSNVYTVNATTLSFVQQPSNVQTNTAMTPPVTVQGVDAGGNLDLNATISITATGATLSGSPVTATTTSGVATFSTLQFTTAATGVTLTASFNSGAVTVTSNTFNITLAPSVLAGWNFFGFTSPNAMVATVYNANMDAKDSLTRGPGAAASTASNSFRTTGFQNNGIDVANTDYFQLTLSPVSGYKISLSAIDATFNGTTSFYASPGVTSQFAYSLDGTTFTLIGSAVTSTSLTMGTVSLSGVSALQNIPDGTTVYLRYYASGQTTTGGWGFSSSSTSGYGLSISGYIEATCTPGSWVGGTSTDASVASNWCGGTLPTASVDVTVSSGTTYAPAIPLGQTLTVKTLTIGNGAALTVTGSLVSEGAVNNGGTVDFNGNFTSQGTFTNTGTATISGSFTAQGTLSNSGTLNVNGTLTLQGSVSNSGTLNAANGTIALAGTSGTQSISATTFNAATVKNLTINNGSGVNLSGHLNLTGMLTPTAGTLTVADSITLKSTSITNTAIVGIGGAGASISGKVILERFIPQSVRALRDIAPGLVVTGTFFNNWQEGGINNNGYGTHITGKQGTVGSIDPVTGFDMTASGNASLYSYDINLAGSGTWNTKTSTNQSGDVPDLLKSYRISIRGDRSHNLTADVTNMTGPATLRTRGSLFVGDLTITPSGVTGASSSAKLSSTTTGYTMIGNPYQAPLNWDSVYANSANINASYWVWDPLIGTTGGYVTYNATNGITSNSGTVPGSSAVTKFIQPGQGFFVRNTSASPTLVIKERYKGVSTANLTTVFKTSGANASKMQINLMKVTTAKTYNMDGAVVVFDNDFSNGINAAEDAGKISNPTENLAINNNSTLLSIEARKQPVAGSDSIGLRITTMTTGANYTLRVDLTAFTAAGVQPYLKDLYTKSVTLLTLGGVTNYNFTTTSNAATYNDRFRIVYTNSTLPVTFLNVKAIQKEKAVEVSWTVNEVDAAKYVVEHSSNNTDFTAIGAVDPKGNGTQTYSLLHSKPVNGVNFYRVRSLDQQGAIKYSGVVAVNLNGKTNAAISVYPNPVKDGKLQLTLSHLAEGRYSITVYNTQGQQVYTQSVNHAGSNSSYGITLPQGLQKGVYSINVVGNNATQQVQTLVIE